MNRVMTDEEVMAVGAQKAESGRSVSDTILDAAYECLSEAGYANVSLRDIAGRAGVALSQLTYYFKNKEGLVSGVVERVTARYIERISGRLHAIRAPRQRFETLVAYFTELADENSRHLRFLADFTAQALWLPAFREQLLSLYAGIAGLIEGENNGTEPRDSEAPQSDAARLMTGALYGLSVQLMLGGSKKDAVASLGLAGHLLE